MPITITAAMRLIACTTATSRFSTALMSTRPRPGYANTFSTTMIPESKPATYSAAELSAGMTEAGRAWRRTTERFEAPARRARST
jgi:hypothetical protein